MTPTQLYFRPGAVRRGVAEIGISFTAGSNWTRAQQHAPTVSMSPIATISVDMGSTGIEPVTPRV